MVDGRGEKMWWIIIAITLALFTLSLNYSASKNNEAYDFYVTQKRCFDKHINNDSLVFVKYIGSDRNEIKHGHHALITINTTDDNKIAVELEGMVIVYDDYEQFRCDWIFNSGDK